MRKVFVISTVLMLALAGFAFARPADQQGKESVRFAFTDGMEARTSQSAPNGIFGLANHTCAGGAGSTTWFGGTHWDGVNSGGGDIFNRWEANMGGEWSFDSGVAHKRVAGKDVLLEGWVPIDNTFSNLPYFRRLSKTDARWAATAAEPVCVGSGASPTGGGLGGNFSFWCGVLPCDAGGDCTNGEADVLCYGDGQGYGNNWSLVIEKTITFDGTAGGNQTVTVAFNHKFDVENTFDFCRVQVDTGGSAAIVVATYTGTGGGSPSITMTEGAELPSGVSKAIKVQMRMTSDGGYSDQDQSNPTACGAWALDDINITGSVTAGGGLSDFEAGANG